MNKISELISKEVISIYECERIGTICAVCFNKTYTKINGYIFFNDETDSENYISSNKIYSLSEQGIFIRNTSKIDSVLEESNSPVNKKAFTISGKYLGKIIDAVIDEKSNLIYFLTNQEQKIEVKNIVNIGEDMVLLKEDEEKINLNQFKPKETFDSFLTSEVNVKIVPIENNAKQKEAFPTKVFANTNNLIGKKAKLTLLGLNNEIIVKENQIINENIIKMAKRHNKFSQLLYISE